MAHVPSKATSATAPATSAARQTSGLRVSGRYWTSLALLLLAVAGVHVVAPWLGVQFRKQAVPLKRSLQSFDAAALAPQYTRDPSSDQYQMTADMVDTLGTTEFFQLTVNDTALPVGHPGRTARIFVTYYTGKPDMVPHVPDECYLAGGYEPIDTRTVEVPVSGIGAEDNEIPVRVVTFRTSQEQQMIGGEPAVVPVMYFFHANGKYATTRDELRLALSMDLFQRYAYYAKIEVTFPDVSRLSAERARTVSVERLGPLLERLMPVLLNDYFDLRVFSKATPAQTATGERGQG